MNEQETIEDIIVEMRKDKRVDPNLMWDNSQVEEHDLHYADRLDAAHRRELSKNASKNGADFGQLGDCTKLREALEAIISGYKNADLCDMNYGEWCHDPANVCVNVPLCKAIHEARAALAAPPRNCDVGVPEERIQRWSKFCKARSKKLPPIHGFEWEDYPYESEVKEGGDK